MRADVVDKYSRARQRKRAGEDLYKQDKRNGDPDQRSRDASWRCCGAVDATEKRCESVCEGEQGEEDAVASRGTQAVRKRRVDEYLEGYADHTEDGEREANAWRGEGEATCEVDETMGMEVGRVRVRGVVAWCGEVDEPEGVEAADVHGEEPVCEKGADQVAGPYAAEGEDSARFVGRVRRIWASRCGGWLEFEAGGRGRCLFIAGDGGVAASRSQVLAEDV